MEVNYETSDDEQFCFNYCSCFVQSTREEKKPSASSAGSGGEGGRIGPGIKSLFLSDVVLSND